MTTAERLVAEVLQHAYHPNSVLPKYTRGSGPNIGWIELEQAARTDPTAYPRMLGGMAAANRLRAKAQAQTMTAVVAIADPSKLDWSRLQGADSTNAPRKPRIRLWASINQRDTLEVLWYPELDEAAAQRRAMTEKLICENSDYNRVMFTGGFGAGSQNAILRFCKDEYISSLPEPDHRSYESKELVKEALEESLMTLLTMLSTLCDVSLDTWPVYDKMGKLTLISAGERLQAGAITKLEELKRERDWAASHLAGTLERVSLNSAEEFNELAAKAAATGEKVTRLIFEKTGKRCSALLTDKIPAIIEKVATSRQLCLDFRAQVLEVEFFHYC
jgi:hypothetical protein